MVHTESDRNLLFLFHKQVHCSVLFSRFHLCREFWKDLRLVRAIPLCWPCLFGNCCSIFRRVVPTGSVFSDWSKQPNIAHGDLNYRGSNLLSNKSYLYIETCSATQPSQHINNMFSISMTTNYFIHELNPRVS